MPLGILSSGGGSGGGGGGMAIGGAVTGGIANSVLFVGPGGVLAQNDDVFVFDPNTGFLGLGMNFPSHRLDVNGSVFFQIGEDPEGFIVYNASDDVALFQIESDTKICHIFPNTEAGAVGIGNTVPNHDSRLYVAKSGPNGTSEARICYNITGNDSQIIFHGTIDGSVESFMSFYDGETGINWGFATDTACAFNNAVRIGGNREDLPQTQLEVIATSATTVAALSNNLGATNFVIADEALSTGGYPAVPTSLGFDTGSNKVWIKWGAGAAEWSPILLSQGNIVGASSLKMNIGGSLFKYFADAGNTTTTETTLYSSSILSGTLATNGDGLSAFYSVNITGSATATSQIRVKFAGTTCFDSTALALTSSKNWQVRVEIIRVTSATCRVSVSLFAAGVTIDVYTDEANISSLDFGSSNYTLSITAQRAGAGAATNDIVAKHGYVNFTPESPQ